MKFPNVYLIEIGPVPCKAPGDEGLTLRVQTPARSRRHAIDRVRRYINGRVTDCRLICRAKDPVVQEVA